MSDAKLRRTVRRCVALLLLPLSVAADAVRDVATEEYFVDALPLGWLVPPVLLYGSVLYLLGSFLSGLSDPYEDDADPNSTESAGSDPDGSAA